VSDVTQILSAIEQGDPHAAEQLLPLVYDELRKLAAQRLAQEKPGQTLQATALVHEAYVRLVDRDDVQYWNSRGHFFAAAAEAMRRILIDQARKKMSRKRGGGLERLPLEEIEIGAPEPAVDLLAVNDALERFERIDKAAADLVKLRYYAGFTLPQAADALGNIPGVMRPALAAVMRSLHASFGPPGCPQRPSSSKAKATARRTGPKNGPNREE
jgi:RNA polymerase sigma factor (TIGR02999 family)